MSIHRRLQELGGCARRRAVVVRPEDAWRLRRAVEGGSVIRVGHGCYALPGTSPDLIAARLAGGVLTCLTLVQMLDLPLLSRPTAAHVAVGSHHAVPRRGVTRPDVVVHWDADVDADCSTARIPLASRATALVHTMRCLPAREVVAVLDSAVNRGLVERTDLAARRPRADKLAFDRIVMAVDGRSQSLPESFARLALRAHGLRAEPQVQIDGVGRVDLLVEGVLVVELDGFAYHGDRGQFREDRRRDRVLHLLGVPVMRFTFDDTVAGTDRLVHEVVTLVRALQRAGARPLTPPRR